MKRFILNTIFILLAVPCIMAETFYLDSGETIEGTLVEDTSSDNVKIIPNEIELPKDKIYKSKRERYDANKNWKRHFFEISIGGGFGINYNSGDGYVSGFSLGGHVATGFTYNYAITEYFALRHGVRFKVDFAETSNTFESWLDGCIEENKSGVKNNEWYDWCGFTFSVVDQFMFGNLKKKQFAAVVDLLYGRTIGGGVGVYYRGFVWKIVYSYDIPSLFFCPNALHCVSLDFGYKIGAGKKK
jgi:hypothetical protein